MANAKEKTIALISSTTGIDATTVGTTELASVLVGKDFIPMFIVIRVTAFTAGSKSVQAIASFGGNSATYDDFINSATYTVANQDYFQTDGPTDSSEVAIQVAGTSFRVSIETASDATVETWAVDLFGYLV